MVAYKYVLTDVREGVGTLTLNRPEKMNAFDGEMRVELEDAARNLVESPEVRVIVVTGAGRAFCAGADVGYMGAALAHQDYDAAMGLVRSGAAVVRMLHQAPMPVLGSLNGAAAGGGANLALACDLRLASDRASIGQVFHRIGLHPDMGGTHFLPRLVGASRALELIWSAEMIPAARCLELGLVNRVVPHADLAAETAAWAARLAALPPVAVRLVKGAIHDSGQRTLDESLAIEDSNQLQCFRSADAAEGLAAFGARRVPVFHGR